MQLPPGFRARPVIGDPWPHALAAAATEEPGAVLWDGSWGRCRAAILLAPDHPLPTGELRDLGMLALFDALAGLAPPQIPVRAEGGTLLVNGGRVASVREAAGPGWAALGFDLALDLQAAAPGETPGQTCLLEEGFGPVAADTALAQLCRHLLRWIALWQEDGAAILAPALAERAALAGVMP